MVAGAQDAVAELREFDVINPASKSSDRVSTRGRGPGCWRPDYATKELGTCEHIEFTLAQLEKKRGAKRRLCMVAGWLFPSCIRVTTAAGALISVLGRTVRVYINGFCTSHRSLPRPLLSPAVRIGVQRTCSNSSNSPPTTPTLASMPFCIPVRIGP